MKFRNLILTGAAMLMAAPMFGSTYYGGFEDLSTTRSMSSDFDYNDLVFSLSGNGLTLKTSDGKWYSKPSVDTNGDPFWDNGSLDGGKKNIGYCIYGGGSCGAGLAPGAEFLANNNGTENAVADVSFSTLGNVSTSVLISITSGKDSLYWYSVGSPLVLNKINTSGVFSFNPGGDFGLAGYNANTNRFYWSQNLSDSDPSHFAFFAPVPEPGTMGVMAGGLILIGSIYRRRKIAAQK